MSFDALAGAAIGLGFLHGLGADHLMAIAALAVDGRGGRRPAARAVHTAVHFAAGHAGVLAAGAALALWAGWALPEAAAGAAERAGGWLLVGLGAAGLWGLRTGRVYTHVHGEIDGRRRWHLHVGPPHRDGERGHAGSRVPAVLGAVFAVSSLRALLGLTPFGAGAAGLAAPLVALLIALFGLGIVLSMSLFGVVLARVLSLAALERLGRSAGAVVGVASILLGVYWALA